MTVSVESGLIVIPIEKDEAWGSIKIGLGNQREATNWLTTFVDNGRAIARLPLEVTENVVWLEHLGQTTCKGKLR